MPSKRKDIGSVWTDSDSNLYRKETGERTVIYSLPYVDPPVKLGTRQCLNR